MSVADLHAAAIALFGAWAAVVAGTAWAHHAGLVFARPRQSHIAGTVRDLEWAHPHVTLWLAVVNRQGVPVLYEFEGESRGALVGRGHGSLIPGDEVTVWYAACEGREDSGQLLVVARRGGRILQFDAGVRLRSMSIR
jgi:hypothetical protein